MSLIPWQPHDFLHLDRRSEIDRLFEDFGGHDYEVDRRRSYRWKPAKEGVLTLNLSKAAVAKAKQIEIKAN